MSKEKLKAKRGITLIALVITIIVMLILVAATVTVALNGGLFKSAKKATADTEIAREEESQLSSGRVQINNVWYDSIEDYIAGNKSENQGDAVTGPEAWLEEKNRRGDIIITRGEQTLNIGDYVEYTTEESPDTKWRVLGVEKGRLLLMADSNVLDENSSELEVTLEGTNWGTDGQPLVDQLNNECQKYLNTEYAESIRSIRVEDINNVTGYNPLYEGKRNPTQEDIDGDIDRTHRYESGQVCEYGNKVKYTWSEDGYVIYDDSGEGGNGKHEEITSYWTKFIIPPDGRKLGSEGLTLECTDYAYYPNTLTLNSSGATVGIETTSSVYKMIFENSSGEIESYFLASPCVYTGHGCIHYKMFCVGSDSCVNGDDATLWATNGSSSNEIGGIRPVVSLKSDVNLAKDEGIAERNGSVTYKIGK